MARCLLIHKSRCKFQACCQPSAVMRNLNCSPDVTSFRASASLVAADAAFLSMSLHSHEPIRIACQTAHPYQVFVTCDSASILFSGMRHAGASDIAAPGVAWACIQVLDATRTKLQSASLAIHEARSIIWRQLCCAMHTWHSAWQRSPLHHPRLLLALQLQCHHKHTAWIPQKARKHRLTTSRPVITLPSLQE